MRAEVCPAAAPLCAPAAGSREPPGSPAGAPACLPCASAREFPVGLCCERAWISSPGAG